MARYPSKASMLRFFCEAGLPAGTVLDVGAQEETRELRLAFPGLRHILFEPASEFHEALRRNYATMDYVLVSAAVSDWDGTGLLHKTSLDGGKITHSTLVENDFSGSLEPVTMLRLDTFMKSRNDPKPYLLKLDVDGNELQILRGCEGIWDGISCVIIEAKPFNIAEQLNFLLSKGFELFDIVDNCYYYGMFWQADLVFIAKRFTGNPNLRPRQTKPFTWSEWIEAASYEAALRECTPVPIRRFRLPRFKFWKRHA